MYFTFNKAKNLCREMPEKLSDSKLQEKYVMLRDFVRYTSNTDCYRDILIDGGYFVDATTCASSGIVPKDIWLFQNLRFALELFSKERQKRFNL